MKMPDMVLIDGFNLGLYKQGYRQARYDVLDAIDLLKSLAEAEHVEEWQAALNELESYVESDLSLKDWYNS